VNKYPGASTIFVKYLQFFFLNRWCRESLVIFTLGSSQQNLSNGVFQFDAVQSATEISLFIMKESGASSILTKYFYCSLTTARWRLVRFFLLDEPQQNLQNAVFKFDIVQTITNISLFLMKKMSRRLHHLCKTFLLFKLILKITLCSFL
jgi:hypothetical protein